MSNSHFNYICESAIILGLRKFQDFGLSLYCCLQKVLRMNWYKKSSVPKYLTIILKEVVSIVCSFSLECSPSIYFNCYQGPYLFPVILQFFEKVYFQNSTFFPLKQFIVEILFINYQIFITRIKFYYNNDFFIII